MIKRFKLYRREGINLFLKNFYISNKFKFLKSILKKKVKNKNKFFISTYFSEQLKEEKKLKIIYGISNKTYDLYCKKLKKIKKFNIINILKLLECRMDNLIYRSGLAYTRLEARQMISHKFFKINNKNFKFSSKIIKIGDYINFNKKKKINFFKIKYFNLIFKKKIFPDWIFINNIKISLYLKKLPKFLDLKNFLNINNEYV